eukprot:6194499-Pleurochrysis_carterae.AAC.2
MVYQKELKSPSFRKVGAASYPGSKFKRKQMFAMQPRGGGQLYPRWPIRGSHSSGNSTNYPAFFVSLWHVVHSKDYAY